MYYFVSNSTKIKTMKAKFLLALPLFLGAVLTGCSKTDNPGTTSDNQVLIVKLPGAANSRAVETPENTGSATTTLDDVRVFLLSNDLVIQEEVFTDAERGLKSKRIELVPSNVDKVIVVANANGAPIAGLRTADAIKKYAFTVAHQYPTGKTGLEGKTMIGEGTPEVKDPDPNPDGHIYKEVTVDIEAITSRIEVGDVKAGTGIEEVQLLAVYINNYYETNAKGTPNLQNEFWTGWPNIPASPKKTEIEIDFEPSDIEPSAYTESRYVDRYNSNVKLSDDTKAYAYHVFSNNLPHVILLIRGKYTDAYAPLENGTDEPMPYFIGWVTYSKYYDSTLGDYIPEMLPNNIYKMGVDANGITINAPDIRPRPEPQDYDLGLNVTVKKWTANVVTPEV